ncbi:uncharacterized protein LOC142560005 isoform X3 [Dermacentor variabilis]|uniref:uncharacterized protein LOC142560005 isoform X3 n=1 Tax=Dermacentor variabilis TaxID=34621 RepID=UPI003F5C96AF
MWCCFRHRENCPLTSSLLMELGPRAVFVPFPAPPAHPGQVQEGVLLVASRELEPCSVSAPPGVLLASSTRQGVREADYRASPGADRRPPGQLKQASAAVFFTFEGVRGVGSSSRPPVSPGASRRSPTGQSRGDYSMPEIARCSN